MDQREKYDPFPTSVDLGRIRYKPDPPKEPKGAWKLLRGALIGAGLALVVCLLENSGAYFLPIFLGITLLAFVDWVRKK